MLWNICLHLQLPVGRNGSQSMAVIECWSFRNAIGRVEARDAKCTKKLIYTTLSNARAINWLVVRDHWHSVLFKFICCNILVAFCILCTLLSLYFGSFVALNCCFHTKNFLKEHKKQSRNFRQSNERLQ